MAQNLKPNRLDNRGGKRNNAGAKPKGNVLFSRRVSPEHFKMLTAYLEFLKKTKIIPCNTTVKLI